MGITIPILIILLAIIIVVSRLKISVERKMIIISISCFALFLGLVALLKWSFEKGMKPKREALEVQNTLWKNCSEDAEFFDVFVFNKKYFYMIDSVVYNNQDSAVAKLEKLEYYYGERRLFLKSLQDNKVYRYCEQ